MLFVDKDSAEAEILLFVAQFCGKSIEVVESPTEEIWCSKPVMKIGPNDFVASLPSILRHIAKSSGYTNLLGSKGACLKTPAEFSSRTRLVQNGMTKYKNDPKSIDVDQVERILSSPIVQHNIDKYQRQLLKQERADSRKRNSTGELKFEKVRRKFHPKICQNWNMLFLRVYSCQYLIWHHIFQFNRLSELLAKKILLNCILLFGIGTFDV